MIQYKCDLCGEVLDTKHTNIIEHFPRRVFTPVTDCTGAKITSFEDVWLEETHLCKSCCCKIAAMFPVIELD